MVYKLEDVTEEEFPEVIRCMWETYENPLQHLYRIFCPLNAGGATSREAAIQESTKRFWEWNVSDPDSYWQKVVDADANKLVGGALWKINRTNPYADAHGDEEAYWHPAGGQRLPRPCLLLIQPSMVDKAADLNIIFTHPTYQRRGVGKLIMDWGVAKAAELDMEMWLNAWRFGRALYQKYGFVTVEHHESQPKTQSPDEAWIKCESEWTDLEEWVMWRPKDGPYVEGKSMRPWESA